VAAAPTMPVGGAFRRAWLPFLQEVGAADGTPLLPASLLDVPPLGFGTTDLTGPGIVEQPLQGAGGMHLRHEPVGAYMIRDAVVHGMFGIVTCGAFVLAESAVHFAPHRLPGADWPTEDVLRLPERPVTFSMPTAYHLLTCNQDNYFHWLLEGVSRFNAAEFRGFGVLGQVGEDPHLLIPPLDAPWKQQTVDLLVPPDVRRTVVPAGATVHVERLVYIRELAGGGMLPHRGLLQAFDRMRAAAYAALGAQPAVPSRRLFISRADSSARVLVNEAEVWALAEAQGFERVVLSEIGVAEQVRLFAEATHVLAPHGAGLTNLLFCRPGTAVCELQMDSYVHWTFRRLAALRGLTYGCIVGTHIPPLQRMNRRNTWRVDPALVAAVLADPRFIGG